MVKVFIIVTVILILFALVMLYIAKYNLMQYFITKIDTAESIIDETLRTRYDLLNKMSKIIKSKVKSTKDYFKQYEKKEENISNFDFDRRLTEYLALCESVVHDHTVLENNKDIEVLFNELKNNEEKLVATKNYYNRETTELNILIRRFPTNIIAKIHRIKIHTYFDGKDLTDDIVDDFKM